MRPKRPSTGEPAAAPSACEPEPHPEGPGHCSQGAESHGRRTDMVSVSRKPESHTPESEASCWRTSRALRIFYARAPHPEGLVAMCVGSRVSQQAETPSSNGQPIRFREPEGVTASRRSFVLTERRPSTPKSIGPASSRSWLPLPASRPRFPRPQNRSRYPMDSSPVFWTIKLLSGAEPGVGKPMPHSPSMESKIPDPKTGDPIPRIGHAPPASRSSRTSPESRGATQSRNSVASKLAASSLPVVRLLPPRREGSGGCVAG